jgi:hypothetical protein
MVGEKSISPNYVRPESLCVRAASSVRGERKTPRFVIFFDLYRGVLCQVSAVRDTGSLGRVPDRLLGDGGCP